MVVKVDLLKYSAATMTPQEFAGVSRDKEAVRERALIRRNLRKLVLPRELALPFTFISIDMCSLI